MDKAFSSSDPTPVDLSVSHTVGTKNVGGKTVSSITSSWGGGHSTFLGMEPQHCQGPLATGPRAVTPGVVVGGSTPGGLRGFASPRGLLWADKLADCKPVPEQEKQVAEEAVRRHRKRPCDRHKALENGQHKARCSLDTVVVTFPHCPLDSRFLSPAMCQGSKIQKAKERDLEKHTPQDPCDSSGQDLPHKPPEVEELQDRIMMEYCSEESNVLQTNVIGSTTEPSSHGRTACELPGSQRPRLRTPPSSNNSSIKNNTNNNSNNNNSNNNIPTSRRLQLHHRHNHPPHPPHPPPPHQPLPARQGGSSTQPQQPPNFRHVPRDLLPSDPSLYWRLMEGERTHLARMASACQDTLMALPPRRGMGPMGHPPPTPPPLMRSSSHLKVVDNEAGVRGRSRALSSPSSLLSREDRVLEPSGENARQLIQFASRLEEFCRLRSEDRISLLLSAGPRTVLLRWTALYVLEHDAWLTCFGECDVTTAASASEGSGHLRESCAVVRGAARFCRSLKSLLKNDVTLFALLHSLVLFDPAASRLTDRQAVSAVADRYYILLKHYLEAEFSFLHADQYMMAVRDKMAELRDLVVLEKGVGVGGVAGSEFRGHMLPFSEVVCSQFSGVSAREHFD
ncbi:uncharacterized protein LOC143294088 [Babylonia areolata]|uniref:uncharacterized protein LOC143294088 n=1 Tax=Babylonia areolata TaxID=304850 RepID=UPI003FD55FC1